MFCNKTGKESGWLGLEGHDENGMHIIGFVSADKVQDIKKASYSTIGPIDKASHLFADGFENTANATFEDEEMQFVSDAVLEIVAEEKESQMTEEELMNQTIENAKEEELEDIKWEEKIDFGDVETDKEIER